MYKLQNNVMIVSGAKNYCIYDLNSRKMYNMNSEYLKYLNELIADNADEVPKTVIEYFVNEGIVVCDDSKLREKIPAYKYGGKIEFAWIEITQNCNLACRHCYEEASKHIKTIDMTLSEFELAVSALESIGVKRIQLVGGEPLIHPNIKEMINRVCGKFDFVEVYTNGTLLNDDLLNYISSKGIALAFSLYSNIESVHDYVTCVPGSQEVTLRSIRKAIDRKITTRVASVEMKDVPRYIFEDELVTSRSDLPRIVGRAGIHLYTRDMLRRKLITKDTFRKPIDVQQFFKNQKVHNCFGTKLYIDCKLDIYPCVMERRISCGNLKSKTIDSMVGTEHTFITKDKVEGCKDCEFRYSCYDCRPDSMGGNLYDKPWYCTYNPYEGSWSNIDSFIESLLDIEKKDS